MHVQPRDRVADRAHDGEVVLTGKGRMDPALEAHLRGAARPGLLAAADDLLVRDEVRRAAEIRSELSFRKRAEPAAEVTHVRVLDVAGDDVRDLVAANLSPQPVRSREHALALVAARAKQTHELFLPELGARVDGQSVSRDERNADVLPGRPAVLACEA